MNTNDTNIGNLTLLSRAMDIRSFRHDLIAGNLSNMDTPNYRSFDLSLKEALGGMEEDTTGIVLARSHSSHIRSEEGTASEVLNVHLNPPEPYSLKGDGNTVNVDGEMAKLAENSLMYHALVQMVTKEFQLYTTAIEGK